MTTIITDNFETKLGTIRTWIETDDNISIVHLNACSILTKGHEIFIQPFVLKNIWTPEIWQYETSKGWRFFVRKINQQKERLAIFCKLINPTSDIIYDVSSGEHLDAIEIEDNISHLHIGTEDGEMLQYRAKASDWMPKRFENEIGFSKSFTEYIDFGFKTTVPNMMEKEEIYFHFVVATDTIRPSTDYPNERDLSTWFAVDKSKWFLDDKLKNTSGNES